MLSSLCTKTEEAILHNEQKLMKSRGNGEKREDDCISKIISHCMSLPNTFMGGNGMMGSGGPPTGQFMGPMYPPFFMGGTGFGIDRNRFRPPMKTCYKCGSPWHLSCNCQDSSRNIKN